MQCYAVKPGAFARVPVTVETEFGLLSYSVRFPGRLCFRLAGAEPAPDQFLMGYTLRASSRSVPGVEVATPFGSLKLDVIRPDTLLVPSAVSLTAPPDPPAAPLLDDFQCYQVRTSHGTKFAPIRGVTVADALENVVIDLVKPTRLCTPASLDGDDSVAPDRPRLVCYRTRSSARFGEV